MIVLFERIDERPILDERPARKDTHAGDFCLLRRNQNASCPDMHLRTSPRESVGDAHRRSGRAPASVMKVDTSRGFVSWVWMATAEHRLQFREVDPRWRDWQQVSPTCTAIAVDIFRRLWRKFRGSRNRWSQGVWQITGDGRRGVADSQAIGGPALFILH